MDMDGFCDKTSLKACVPSIVVYITIIYNKLFVLSAVFLIVVGGSVLLTLSIKVYTDTRFLHYPKNDFLSVARVVCVCTQ
jgi:hypothetical protein